MFSRKYVPNPLQNLDFFLKFWFVVFVFYFLFLLKFQFLIWTKISTLKKLFKNLFGNIIEMLIILNFFIFFESLEQ